MNNRGRNSPVDAWIDPVLLELDRRAVTAATLVDLFSPPSSPPSINEGRSSATDLIPTVANHSPGSTSENAQPTGETLTTSVTLPAPTPASSGSSFAGPSFDVNFASIASPSAPVPPPTATAVMPWGSSTSLRAYLSEVGITDRRNRHNMPEGSLDEERRRIKNADAVRRCREKRKLAVTSGRPIMASKHTGRPAGVKKNSGGGKVGIKKVKGKGKEKAQNEEEAENEAGDEMGEGGRKKMAKKHIEKKADWKGKGKAVIEGGDGDEEENEDEDENGDEKEMME